LRPHSDGILGQLQTAIGRLRHSFEQVETTGVDIVDLQTRLEGEGAALAAPLKALGELLTKTPGLQASLSQTLLALEECAERVAAAIFPKRDRRRGRGQPHVCGSSGRSGTSRAAC
jgi:hypothetical protein